MTNQILTLGSFVSKGVALGGRFVKNSMQQSILFRGVEFDTKKDADTFADLIMEEFPNETVFVGTIQGVPCAQLKDSSKF